MRKAGGELTVTDGPFAETKEVLFSFYILDVPDLDAAEAQVLEIGARKHEHQPGETFRVFTDPAGHPFCLCRE